MNKKYAVIFEQAKANWAAYVPDLPGCVSTGLREFGERVPEPTSIAKEIEVTPTR